MSRKHLNLTAGAWRRLRRNWHLAPTPHLLWQTLVPGSMFSLVTRMQKSVMRERLTKANFSNAIVILGYWRSGTTLLHELLALDTRYTFPTTHACMNPQHFMLTEQTVLSRDTPGAQRPMDEMEVKASSPQESEFALLSLGARSPYEALLVPQHLNEALQLADPADLNREDAARWRAAFLNFHGGVSVRGGGRPFILKSPTDGFRVPALRELLPDARYILIVRDPWTNFESVVRMWRRMFELYSVQPIPAEDRIREAVLADRPRFEAKLARGVAGLPSNRFAILNYESLIADPRGCIERLYDNLELGDFGPVREPIAAEIARRGGYRAKAAPPSPDWSRRIATEWASVFERYGYPPHEKP